ncbi:WD40 repeat domain-containing protein [Limnoglobus roseus]|uniref:WD40 repeat domain-containing protein n=1 Tax=Limnoglobus roseus TaxID=2598579 RepID=A0A5C1ADD7_9BACT|nr:WD40 repeat domain-containing protein [Limnoglobus roseus]QEL17311.1 WD40 repeat domain-containing protein [Limnoglobus roseus]
MLTAVLLVALFPLAPDRPLAAFGRHPLHVGPAAVAVSPDGQRIFTLSPGGIVRTLDAADGRELSRESPANPVADRVPLISADGTLAVLLSPMSSGLEIGRGLVNRQWAAIEERRSTPEAVGLSGDGQVLAAAFRHDSGVTRLRVVKGSGSLPRPVAPIGGHAHDLALSQAGDWLIALAHESEGEKNLLSSRPCQLFDVSTGLTIWSRDESFRHVLITADDRYAVLTGGSAKVPNRVVDLPDGEPARDRTPPKFAIVGPPVVSADGRMLYAATSDSVVAWDLVAGREKFRLPVKGIESPVRRMALSADGRFLVTNFDGLRKWDAATGKPLFGPPATAHAGAVRAVRFHPGGREFASLASDGSFVRWDVASARVLERIEGLKGDDLRFGPRGWQVVDFSDGVPRLTSTRTRTLSLPPVWQKQLKAAEYRHTASFLSADGETATTIVSSMLKAEVVQFTWKAVTGEPLTREELPAGGIGRWVADVSPDSRWRITGRGISHSPNGGPSESSADVVQVHRSLGNALASPIFMTDRQVAASIMTLAGLGTFANGVVGSVPDTYRCFVVELASVRPMFDAEVVGGRWHVISPDDRFLGVVRTRELSLASLISSSDPPSILPIGYVRHPAALAFAPDASLVAVGREDGAIELWAVPRPDVPPLVDVKSVWDALAQAEPRVARLLIEQLVRSPTAVGLLADKLPVTPPPKVDDIPAVIAKLDSPVFAERDAATRTLRALGRLAKVDLEATVKKTESVELRQRAEDLLKAVAASERFVPTPELVRYIRAVEVLERIGSPDAVKMLEALTVQTRDSRLSEEAAAALARLKLRDVQP